MRTGSGDGNRLGQADVNVGAQGSGCDEGRCGEEEKVGSDSKTDGAVNVKAGPGWNGWAGQGLEMAAGCLRAPPYARGALALVRMKVWLGNSTEYTSVGQSVRRDKMTSCIVKTDTARHRSQRSGRV